MASGACHVPVLSVNSIQLFAGSYDIMFGTVPCPLAEHKTKKMATMVKTSKKMGFLAISLKG